MEKRKQDNKFFDPDDAIDIGVSEGDGQDDEDDTGEKPKKQRPYKPVYLKDLMASQATGILKKKESMYYIFVLKPKESWKKMVSRIVF